jgi:hypothetical protein
MTLSPGILLERTFLRLNLSNSSTRAHETHDPWVWCRNSDYITLWKPKRSSSIHILLFYVCIHEKIPHYKNVYSKFILTDSYCVYAWIHYIYLLFVYVRARKYVCIHTSYIHVQCIFFHILYMYANIYAPVYACSSTCTYMIWTRINTKKRWSSKRYHVNT